MIGRSTSCDSASRRAAALCALVLSTAALAACTEAAPPAVGTSAEALTRTITIRRGTFGSVADAYVSSSSMKKNFGDKHKLLVSAQNEALLRFDLSSIPDNAVIDQATLTLTINGGEEEEDDDCHDGDHEGHPIAPIKVRRVTAPWSEGTVTYKNFDQRFAPAVVGTLVLSNRSSTKRVDVRALVQGWVAGTYPNHGLILTTSGRQHTLIVASEQQRAGRRPALEIQYTTPDDHCEADPCVHGACTNLPDGFTCACEPGWTGATCDNDIDDCAGAPCEHGTCTDLVNGYACACAPGFTGGNCETDVDDCAPSPCANGGVCTDGVADFTCACPAGWGGETCADDLDSCAAAPCQNGATCTDQPGGFTCTCAAGFVGALCETNPDDCAGVTCQNGGTCEDGAGAFTCDCPAGYGGALCETNLDDCVANACGHGTCIDQVAGYACTCEPGFTGATCEVDIDDCAASPCVHGTCTDLVAGFACACDAGFTGATCELVLDDCEPDPCNYGACSELVDGFACACPPNVVGATCDVPCRIFEYPAPDGMSCLACPDTDPLCGDDPPWPAATFTTGPGVSFMYRGNRTTFTIHPRDGAGLNTVASILYLDRFSVTVVGPTGPVPATMTNDGAGGYTVVYTATSVGIHTVLVTFDGQPIAGMPIEVIAREPPVAANSYAVGAGLTSAQVGVPALFTVIARDQYGIQRVDGEDDIPAEITGTASITPEVTDNGDGTYTYIYTPTVTGAYALSITVFNQNIVGSPFSLTVQ